MTNDIWRLSATEVAALVRARKISAREVAIATLGRISDVNGELNAIVDCRPEVILPRADEIDRVIRRGEDPGPLAGVTTTIKISVDQAGFATTNGLTQQCNKIAESNSPVVDNLLKAGSVIVGRSNSPTMSLRWFTDNLVHGATHNPRDLAITPGGSSGGAAVAVTAGMCHVAHGTDIAGSIRYPAYACGIHGIKPTLGRVPTWNASSPDRGIGPQIMAVSGPIARSIADLRVALKAMAAPDARDPWWVPAPLAGSPVERRVALCMRPDGLKIVAEVEMALQDAARRLEADGWMVEEISTVPPLREPADLQLRLWLSDGFASLRDTIRLDGDAGALAVLDAITPRLEGLPKDTVVQALTRRVGLVREWSMFLDRHPVLLIPVSAELPFRNNLDRESPAAFERVWEAQLTMIGIPFLGLPGLTVSTGLVGTVPMGVQIVAGRYREDLCLLAGESIERGGVPIAPIDPVWV